MKIITPKQIRHIDSIAINNYGIASVTLMENSGYAVAEVAKKILNKARYRKICVICGKGNNGGDGLVVSRHLLNSGFNVDIYILSRISALTDDARFNLRLLKLNGYIINEIINLAHLRKFVSNFDYNLVIDAIFGTGFSGGNVPKPIRSLVSFLNKTECKVISVDIPSGLNGLSGKVYDVAIKSDITVTFGLPKKGLFFNEGPRHAGKLIVKNIGFPNSLLT